MEKRRKWYRKIIGCMFALNCLALVWAGYRYLDTIVPDELHLFVSKAENLDVSLPIAGVFTGKNAEDISVNAAAMSKFSLNEKIEISSSREGDYRAELKLFGILPYKSMQVHVVESKRVMPSGEVVGLYMEMEGILVLGTGEVETDRGKLAPAENIVKSGDYILQVGEKKVVTISEMIEALQQAGEGKVRLRLRRDDKEIPVRVENVLAKDGVYKIGVWVREDTEGIGTLTYIDEDNRFGALGHGITDADTGVLLEKKKGSLYDAQVTDISRGEEGNPGELSGIVYLSPESLLGQIDSNSPYGIFGKIKKTEQVYDYRKSMEIGLKQDIHTGPATILCQVDGSVKEYTIVIRKISINSTDNKGMEIEVTDPELIRLTGGIVQGMSGAPIIQDGKCIGAVTHVFVRNPLLGYATFIERMLEN